MEYETIIDFWKNRRVANAAELEVVLDSYSVKFAYNSGKIENDNITFHDTREIFDNDGVTSYTGDLKTLFEIQNAKIAYKYILEAFDRRETLTETFVKKVQKLLTIGTYDERRYSIGERPGEYKKHDYVTGKHEVGALPEDVSEEMSELLEEMVDTGGADVLLAAAYFHAKFENIHPFADGNGRAGRLLMNYFLLLNDHPPITIFEEDRKAYYTALEAFDLRLDLKPLVSFLTEQLSKTWEPAIDRHLTDKKRGTSLAEVISKAKKKKDDIDER